MFMSQNSNSGLFLKTWQGNIHSTIKRESNIIKIIQGTNIVLSHPGKLYVKF